MIQESSKNEIIRSIIVTVQNHEQLRIIEKYYGLINSLYTIKEDLMKNKNIVLCAGVLSMAMLCGCEVKIQNENPTNVTAEATQEAVETSEGTETEATPEAAESIIEDEEKTTTAESNNVEDYTSEDYSSEDYSSEEIETQEETEEDGDSYADLASLMTAIYEVDTNSTDVESIAEQLKDYSFTYGAPSTSSVFESMANDWFDTMEDVEGTDIRSEFSDCFSTVTLTAQKMDEDLEFDLSYLNVINGISAAIGE